MKEFIEGFVSVWPKCFDVGAFIGCGVMIFLTLLFIVFCINAPVIVSAIVEGSKEKIKRHKGKRK